MIEGKPSILLRLLNKSDDEMDKLPIYEYIISGNLQHFNKS